MSKIRKGKRSQRMKVAGYGYVLGGMIELLEQARRLSARTINAIITTTYWEMGRRIVEFEQSGQDQAAYGTVLIERLATDLTRRFGRALFVVVIPQGDLRAQFGQYQRRRRADARRRARYERCFSA